MLKLELRITRSGSFLDLAGKNEDRCGDATNHEEQLRVIVVRFNLLSIAIVKYRLAKIEWCFSDMNYGWTKTEIDFLRVSILAHIYSIQNEKAMRILCFCGIIK